MGARGEFGDVALTHGDHSGGTQPRNNGRIIVGHVVGKQRGALSAAHPGHVVGVLMCHRQSMQRRQVGPGERQPVGRICAIQGFFWCQGDHGVDHRIHLGDAVQLGLHGFPG